MMKLKLICMLFWKQFDGKIKKISGIHVELAIRYSKEFKESLQKPFFSESESPETVLSGSINAAMIHCVAISIHLLCITHLVHSVLVIFGTIRITSVASAGCIIYDNCSLCKMYVSLYIG